MASDGDARAVQCAACGAQLRVRAGDLRGHGKCPKCGKPVVFAAPSGGQRSADKTILATLEAPDAGPPGPPRLVVVAIAGQAKVGTKTPPGEPITIGRDPSNTICVADSRASKQHAEIAPSKDGFVLRDLGSTNGSSLNDEPVTEKDIVAGDLVGAGGALLLVVRAEASAGIGGFTVAKRAVGLDASGTLVGLSGPVDGGVYPLGRSPITIGRAPGVTVQLDDPAISDFHAQIANTVNGPRVLDLGSGTGVIVNEKVVETHSLYDGDVIALGGVRFRFEMATGISQPSARPAGTDNRRRDDITASAVQHSEQPTTRMRAVQGTPRLILRCIEGKDKEREWQVVGPRMTIGRGSEADIVLADPVASRVHAAITVDADGATLADLHSRNGTLVNGQKVESARIGPGDKLGVGGTVLLVQAPGA